MTDPDGRVVEIRAEPFPSSGCEPLMLFWYVSVGDTVALGQELCEVETTKSVFLVTAPVPGRIVEICVPEGGAVGSCQVLARLLAAG